MGAHFWNSRQYIQERASRTNGQASKPVRSHTLVLNCSPYQNLSHKSYLKGRTNPVQNVRTAEIPPYRHTFAVGTRLPQPSCASLPGLCSPFCNSHLGPPEPTCKSVQCWWAGQSWLHSTASRVLAKCTPHRPLIVSSILGSLILQQHTGSHRNMGEQGTLCCQVSPKASGDSDDTIITFVSKPFLLQSGLALMPCLR